MSCASKNRIVGCRCLFLMSLALGLTLPNSQPAFAAGPSEPRKTHTDFIHSELKVVVDEFGSDAQQIPADFV